MPQMKLTFPSGSQAAVCIVLVGRAVNSNNAGSVTILAFRRRVMRSRHIWVLVITAATGLLAGNHVAVRAQRRRTTKDRVYSDAQAARGQALYKERCASCHGDALQGQNGPPLTGSEFASVWGGQSLSDLTNKIRNTM